MSNKIPTKIYAIYSNPNAGYDYDKRKILDSDIKIGDKIEVKDAAVHSFSTDVWLVGYDKPFNSVSFNFVDENGNEYDIIHDPRFRCYY